MHLPQVDAHFYKERIERQTSKTLQQKRSTWGGKTVAAGVGLMEGLMECCEEEGRGIGEDLNL